MILTGYLQRIADGTNSPRWLLLLRVRPDNSVDRFEYASTAAVVCVESVVNDIGRHHSRRSHPRRVSPLVLLHSNLIEKRWCRTRRVRLGCVHVDFQYVLAVYWSRWRPSSPDLFPVSLCKISIAWSHRRPISHTVGCYIREDVREPVPCRWDNERGALESNAEHETNHWTSLIVRCSRANHTLRTILLSSSPIGLIWSRRESNVEQMREEIIITHLNEILSSVNQIAQRI